MADVTTTALQLVLQETGGNSNTWGSILNDDLDIIEDAITGSVSFAVTTANVTLSDAQNRSAVLKTTGALTGDRSVIVRDALKIWDVYNGCSGGFDLTVKTSLGTGVIIPQGEWKRVRCDATNVEDMAETAALIADDAVGTDQIQDASVTSAKLSAEVLAVPPGLCFPWPGSTSAVPSGYILLNGLTIGDATSGANRANADTESLFTLLWEGSAQTELAILTSGGGASSRGASAAADFAAHKRMPLPDLRGRVVVGNDTMGSSAGSANRITSLFNGDTQHVAGGTETTALTSAQSGLQAHTHTGPSHTHFMFANVSGNSGSNYPTASEQVAKDNSTGGSGSYDMFGTSTAATLGIVSSSGTGNTGSNSTANGSAHTNMQPSWVLHWIAKL